MLARECDSSIRGRGGVRGSGDGGGVRGSGDGGGVHVRPRVRPVVVLSGLRRLALRGVVAVFGEPIVHVVVTIVLVVVRVDRRVVRRLPRLFGVVGDSGPFGLVGVVEVHGIGGGVRVLGSRIPLRRRQTPRRRMIQG